MPPASFIPDSLPWSDIAGPLAAAEDWLARLDERISTSPIRNGFAERTHFLESRASLALDGGLVELEDLILHDANMDVRASTPELVRAHRLVRTRRAVAAAEPALAIAAALKGRGGDAAPAGGSRLAGETTDIEEADAKAGSSVSMAPRETDAVSAALADLDAALARAGRTLGRDALEVGEGARPQAPDPQSESSGLSAWRATVAATRGLPPTLAAAMVLEAWSDLAPLENEPGLGRLLAAALLVERGKTRSHLACLSIGLRAIPRERRQRARTPTARLTLGLGAIETAARAGLADHDRWLTARTLLLRKCEGRRTNSHLPALVELVLARPIVSAGMIAQALQVTPRAAQDLVADLGLREMTGRGRYRAWGII